MWDRLSSQTFHIKSLCSVQEMNEAEVFLLPTASCNSCPWHSCQQVFFPNVHILCGWFSLGGILIKKNPSLLFCNQFAGRSRSTSTSHFSSFSFFLQEGILQSPNMCICKIGRQHLENHLLRCEASLKREQQQPFAISQPSLLFFLAVLHCFFLEQTSYECTQMCVICAQ